MRLVQLGRTDDGRPTKRPKHPHLIELRVDDARQLFETLDPFPFHERDIDTNAENYIVGWARELPADRPLKIILHLPAARVREGLEQELRVAFANFFRYRADRATMDLRELLRIGRLSLAVGMAALLISVLAAQQVQGLVTSPSLARSIEEGLIILGWVANWRPLEIFLYDWLPIVRRRSLYHRLAAARVELRQSKNNTEGNDIGAPAKKA